MNAEPAAAPFRLPVARRITLAALLGAAGLLSPAAARAQDLIVEGANSPYALASGALNTANTYVGINSSGVFDHTGGTHTVNANLVLGFNPGSTGTYNLSGADSSLSTGEAYIGLDGTGAFNQNAGTFSTNGQRLYVGYSAGNSSSFTLSGTGSLTTGNTSLSVGTSVFTQSGASTHTTGTLTLGDFNSAGNATYNLDGGTLAANNVTRGFGAGVFNFNGGALQARQDNATFFQGLTTANVRGGGANVDTAGFAVTVAQALIHASALGATADGA